MTIVKRRRKTTAQAKIEAAQQALLRDQTPPPGANRFTDLGRWEKVKDLWLQNRAKIMAEWIKERPGTRPLAWWILDCPVTPPESFGLGSGLRRPGIAYGWARDPARVPPAAEQRAFLAKHGLLQPGEE